MLTKFKMYEENDFLWGMVSYGITLRVREAAERQLTSFLNTGKVWQGAFTRGMRQIQWEVIDQSLRGLLEHIRNANYLENAR